MCKFLLSTAFIAHVSCHGVVTRFGTATQATVPREPQTVFRYDAGLYGENGLRCMQADANSPSARWQKGCKDSPDIWAQTQNVNLVEGYKSLRDATEDEGYCLGWSSGGFMRNNLGLYAPSGPQWWGDRSLPTFCAGDTIEKTTAFTAYHGGAHWVDMIPQNDEQTKNMPICPDGSNTNPFPLSRDEWPIPCFWPTANPVSSKGTIVLDAPRTVSSEPNSEYFNIDGTPASSAFQPGAKRIVRYDFTLPTGVDYQSGPITFRWMWMCGVDISTGTLQYYGQGELWHNCIDALIGDQCGGEVIPTTTQAPNIPTTAEPSDPSPTTAGPTPTEPSPAPVNQCTTTDPSSCASRCVAACGDQYWVSAPGVLYCWAGVFYCECEDGSRKEFDDCPCTDSSSPYCPSSPGPAPTPAPTPTTPAPTPTTPAPTPTTPAPTPTEAPTPAPTPTTAAPAPAPTTPAPTPVPGDLVWVSRSQYLSDETCSILCSVNNPICCKGSECYDFQLCRNDDSSAPNSSNLLI